MKPQRSLKLLKYFLSFLTCVLPSFYSNLTQARDILEERNSIEKMLPQIGLWTIDDWWGKASSQWVVLHWSGVPGCYNKGGWALEILVSSYCCSSYGAAIPFSSLAAFSSSSIGNPVLCPTDGYEHLLLYLSGTGRASQETGLSGSCQLILVGVCNSV